ncbi:single-stranded DNA-binding protein [Tissierella creatinini]|nr:single-stranded DNA-binding protein [Tissierella creatinini]TJX66685.1 single-stranded DNA-binding protein [Soehngenia saccharolytica]
MVDKIIEANKVKIVGKVISDKEFSHEMYGEKFFVFELEVPRLSSSVDILPVTISERLLFNLDFDLEHYVIIEGQLRSYNRYIEANNKLVLTIFARELYVPNEEELQETLRKPNEIYLDGYICKKPVYRTTPFGREITDMLIAVNRPYNKSDYIPCIAWGRNARFCENLDVGDHIRLWGRIQSREYQKKLYTGDLETKTAFEVSLSKMEFVENDNNRVNEMEG